MRGAKQVGDHGAEHRNLLLHEGEALCAAVLVHGDREVLGRSDGALLAVPVVECVIILLLRPRSSFFWSDARRSFAFRSSASALVSFLNVNVSFGIANLLRWVFSSM